MAKKPAEKQPVILDEPPVIPVETAAGAAAARAVAEGDLTPDRVNVLPDEEAAINRGEEEAADAHNAASEGAHRDDDRRGYMGGYTDVYGQVDRGIVGTVETAKADAGGENPEK